MMRQHILGGRLKIMTNLHTFILRQLNWSLLGVGIKTNLVWLFISCDDYAFGQREDESAQVIS